MEFKLFNLYPYATWYGDDIRITFNFGLYNPENMLALVYSDTVIANTSRSIIFDQDLGNFIAEQISELELDTDSKDKFRLIDFAYYNPPKINESSNSSNVLRTFIDKEIFRFICLKMALASNKQFNDKLKMIEGVSEEEFPDTKLLDQLLSRFKFFGNFKKGDTFLLASPTLIPSIARMEENLRLSFTLKLKASEKKYFYIGRFLKLNPNISCSDFGNIVSIQNYINKAICVSEISENDGFLLTDSNLKLPIFKNYLLNPSKFVLE